MTDLINFVMNLTKSARDSIASTADLIKLEPDLTASAKEKTSSMRLLIRTPAEIRAFLHNLTTNKLNIHAIQEQSIYSAPVQIASAKLIL